jgi:hypothetical protein
MDEIRGLLASLGDNAIALLKGHGFGVYFSTIPAPHFWFSNAALFLAGSFAFTVLVGLIGIRQMISNRVFSILLVVAIALSALAWCTAAKQEEDSTIQASHSLDLEGKIGNLNGQLAAITQSNKKQEEQLSKVASQNTELQGSMAKIAGAANLNPNQSAERLADEIIKRLPGAPWHLTDDEKSRFGGILDAVSVSDRFPIDVEALIGSNQSQMYKDDLGGVIHLHNWEITGGVDTSIKADLEGLYIAIKEGTSEQTIPLDDVAIANMLNSAGIKFGFATFPTIPDKGVKLLIGTKWTN